MENKGIIVSGGTFKAKTVAVGENSKIEIAAPPKVREDVKSSENAALASKIKGLIKESHIKEATEMLFLHFKNSDNKAALNAMIMHSAALNTLEMQENLEVLTHEQAKIDRAKVTNAVLQLVDSQL